MLPVVPPTPPGARELALLHRVRRGLHFVVLAAVVWVVVLAIAAIAVTDRSVLARFDRAWPWLATATLAAFIGNHLLRFGRWQWMLHVLGARVPVVASFAIFMAGLGLLPTPGKIGVAARSLLLTRHGVSGRVSLAAYFAERLFDLAGLLLLATAFYRGPLAGGITVVGIAGVACLALLARYPDTFVVPLRRWVGRWPRLVVAVDAAAGMLHAARRLLELRWALVFVALGMAANVVVGVLIWRLLAYFAIDTSVGTGIGGLALAHLTGSASMAPGGLGGFEVALLLDLERAGAQLDQALIILICVRIVTLWAGVVVGLPLLLMGLRRDRVDA